MTNKKKSINQKKKKQEFVFIDCPHCKDTPGMCLTKTSFGVKHSCQYCVAVAKKTVKIIGNFPEVPCGYCNGSGKKSVKIEIKK